MSMAARLLACLALGVSIAGAAETPAGAMVWIPAGEFWMGSSDLGFPDARPVHRVRVDGFWMSRTEVTNEQFARFVEATG